MAAAFSPRRLCISLAPFIYLRGGASINQIARPSERFYTNRGLIVRAMHIIAAAAHWSPAARALSVQCFRFLYPRCSARARSCRSRTIARATVCACNSGYSGSPRTSAIISLSRSIRSPGRPKSVLYIVEGELLSRDPAQC